MGDRPRRSVPAFLIDSQLPRALATALVHHGFDALHIADWHDGYYRNAPDRDLLVLATEESRVIITFDLATLSSDAYALLSAGQAFSGVLVVVRSIGQRNVGAQLAAVLDAIAQGVPVANTVVYLRRHDR